MIRDTIKRIPGAKRAYHFFFDSPGSWLFHSENANWMRDSDNFKALPFLYKLFGTYFLYVPSNSKNTVVGAQIVHRIVSGLTRLFNLKSSTFVRTGGYCVYLNLLDPRSLVVPCEICEDKNVIALNRFVKPGDTFVDVGANHGSFSIAAAKLLESSGLIVAIEPQPILADLVRKSLDANQVKEFQMHEFACSDEDGTDTFFVPRATSGSAGVFKDHSATSAFEVITVALKKFDSAVDWQKFPGRVFVKLDVEGSESKFLAGSGEFLSVRRPPIMLEVNPSSISASGHSIDNLIDALKLHGYDRFCEISDPEIIPLQDLELSKNRNIVVLHRDA